MSQTRRERLDRLLVDRGLVESRQKAQAMIMAGKVKVDGEPATKAGQTVRIKAQLVIDRPDHDFASRGGLKLAEALKIFKLGVHELICLDVGASTGGWTDCLLQNGAQQVFAVDVGYGQLAWKLQRDERVVNFERHNIRYLTREQLGYEPDSAVIDVSFISLKKVLTASR